jgi:hypothetical protein
MDGQTFSVHIRRYIAVQFTAQEAEALMLHAAGLWPDFDSFGAPTGAVRYAMVRGLNAARKKLDAAIRKHAADAHDAAGTSALAASEVKEGSRG